MNILVAPNSMKGSINAVDFAKAIEQAFRAVSPLFHVRKVPIADGGDFTGPILIKALSAKIFRVEVSDPLGRPVSAEIGISDDTAIIEMASASGLRLLNPDELNPETASTFGTGQLIKRAIELGCTKILLGVGGSATVDGGIGLLHALGFEFLDNQGNILPAVAKYLAKIEKIKFPDDFSRSLEITILCDVNNPLLGNSGAAGIYGPQKGADAEMVERLEAGLVKWAKVLENYSGKDIRNLEGMGAAGGIASGLVSLLQAKLVGGADHIFDLLQMDNHVTWADLVITGEGKIDSQSLALKAPVAIANRAKRAGKPVFALAGTYEEQKTPVFDAIFSIINKPMQLEEATKNAEKLIKLSATQVASLILRSDKTLNENHLIYSSAYKNFMDNNLIKAEKDLMELGEKYAAFWYLKGLINKKLQKWGEALNCFRKSLETDPGTDAAQLNIDMVKNIISFTNPQLFNP